MSSSPRPPDARSLVAVAACSSASIACSTLLAFCLLFCLCVASLLGLSFAETEKKRYVSHVAKLPQPSTLQ